MLACFFSIFFFQTALKEVLYSFFCSLGSPQSSCFFFDLCGRLRKKKPHVKANSRSFLHFSHTTDQSECRWGLKSLNLLQIKYD